MVRWVMQAPIKDDPSSQLYMVGLDREYWIGRRIRGSRPVTLRTSIWLTRRCGRWVDWTDGQMGVAGDTTTGVSVNGFNASLIE